MARYDSHSLYTSQVMYNPMLCHLFQGVSLLRDGTKWKRVRESYHIQPGLVLIACSIDCSILHFLTACSI